MRKSFFGLFLALLSLSELQRATEFFPIPTLNENRKRAPKPDGGRPNGFLLEHLYNHGVKFSHDFEKYYNDHYGFRDLFILTKNQLDYSLFGHSDEILLGEDGFLFFRNMVEGDLIEAERLSEEKTVWMKKNLLRFSRYLRKRGMKLVVVLCRDKDSIYADHLRSPTAVRPQRVHSEVYVDFLKRYPEILFIDDKEIMQAARLKAPVFYKTDFHWNSFGASALGKELVNALAKLERMAPLWVDEAKLKTVEGYSGTQNLYLATFHPTPEVAYEVESNLSSKFEKIEHPPYPFENFTRSSASEKEQTLPSTVIIGNSFTPYLFKTDFPAFFKEVGYIFKGHLKATPIEQILSTKPKYVVLQFNEFDFGTFYTDSAVWNFLKD